MLGRVVLGRIICKIFLSALPVDVELFLLMPVANPIKSHIHCFGSALAHCVSEDTNGTFVVELDRRRALWMAHLLKGGTDWDSVFGVVSDSWTEDMTASIILLFTRIGALCGGGGSSGLIGSFGFMER